MMSFSTDDFKTQQLKYERVKAAYDEKSQAAFALLAAKGIAPEHLRLFFRALKKERLFEVWAKNETDAHFQLLISYPIAGYAGNFGPKRKQGDMQIPEGFYVIERYNPISNFHLSLGVNYPNQSDRILGVKGNYGGDIFIHGANMTVGCIPLTDDKIKEVYLYAVEARNAGQTQIPVHIFPSKLDDVHFEELKTIARSNEFLEYWTIWSEGKPADANKFIRFWESLKKGYDYFDKTNTLPHVSVKSNGEYQVN